jgi:hypothetical protein
VRDDVDEFAEGVAGDEVKVRSGGPVRAGATRGFVDIDREECSLLW